MGEMKTRWAAKMNPDAPLPEYPRPSLVREKWTQPQRPLGLCDRGEGRAAAGEVGRQDRGAVLCRVAAFGRAALRGGGEEAVVPARASRSPAAEGRASGCCCTSARSTGRPRCGSTARKLGDHRGGYDPFSFDITDALKDGDNELVVSVWDPDRRRPAAARQAGREPARDLVHGGDRDLADGVARGGAGTCT